jgi:hypothetical protein
MNRGINIVIDPENEYAFVETATSPYPCQAQAQGGNIDVECNTLLMVCLLCMKILGLAGLPSR